MTPAARILETDRLRLAILADAAVAISVAVQHGVPGAALAKSVGRLPTGPVALSDLD